MKELLDFPTKRTQLKSHILTVEGTTFDYMFGLVEIKR